MRRGRAATVLVAAATLALLFAGCTQPGRPPPTSSLPVPAPNFTGDWSTIPGDYRFVGVRTSVVEHNATTNETIARAATCRVPFSHRVDEGNHVIEVPKDRMALHPYDPGDLRVMLQHELVWDRPACVIAALYPLNENATSPSVCLWGLPASQEQVKIPWRCHLPVEPYNNVSAQIWTNISLTMDPTAAQGYRIDVNGVLVAGGDNATWVRWVHDERRPVLHEVRVDVTFIGAWPLANIRRT